MRAGAGTNFRAKETTSRAGARRVAEVSSIKMCSCRSAGKFLLKGVAAKQKDNSCKLLFQWTLAVDDAVADLPQLWTTRCLAVRLYFSWHPSQGLCLLMPLGGYLLWPLLLSFFLDNMELKFRCHFRTFVREAVWKFEQEIDAWEAKFALTTARLFLFTMR